MLKAKKRMRLAAGVCGFGMLFQFGGCDLGTISLTQSISGREAIIALIRGAILTPIDALITEAVNDAFGGDED